MDGMTKFDLGIEQEELKTGANSLNFAGCVPRTLRHAFTEGLEQTLGSHFQATGVLLKSLVYPGLASGMDDDIRAKGSIEDLPDVITSVGFGTLFSRWFLNRFLRKGCFSHMSAGPLSAMFEEAGLSDPDGWYTIFGVEPFVMLLDQRQAGDIPPVLKWGDLLDPAFRGKAILGGSDDPAEDVPLIYFYKEYGVEGLARLAANVKGVCYACRINSLVGSTQIERAAVYILPWVYAKFLSGVDGVSVIWPEEGALVNPLCIIVKPKKKEKTAPILSYIAGPELGREGARRGFISPNPRVDNGLPEGARLKWLGWDYIKSRDVAELRERVHRLFIVLRREAGQRRAKEG